MTRRKIKLTHEVFHQRVSRIKGADTVNLDIFPHMAQVMPRPQAHSKIGRLRTSCNYGGHDLGTRYRSRHARTRISWIRCIQPSPVLRLAHPQSPEAMPTLTPSDHIQALAQTPPGFHFATIDQGGTSLYPSLASRVTNVEVLRWCSS